jgi:proteic killer suppression protein
MIRSFRDKDTQRLFQRKLSKRIPKPLHGPALRKLLLLEAAESLNDLNALPGNRLEKLSSDRAGQYSIRINDQWRICFRWTEGNVDDVEVVDYH